MKVLNKASCCSSVGPVQKQNIFAPRPFATPVEEGEAPAAGPGIGFSLADISILLRKTVQPKLRLGPVGDRYEQEADRVADEVMRMPEPNSASLEGSLIQRASQECEEDEELLQTKEISGQNADITPGIESRINAIRGGGRPLAESERAFFEPRFGRDFGQVRVHIDAPAAEAARVVNARAFTIGQSIVFGMGQYDPASKNGKYLLAHELVHTVQQRKGIQRQLQLTRLAIYSDPSKWKNDPAKISSFDLVETDEFKWLDKIFGAGTLWWFTGSEILLALRLIIRDMHTKSVPKSLNRAKFINFAIPYLERAERQLGAADKAEALAGRLSWLKLAQPDFSNPATARSVFTRWLLVPKSPEPSDTSTMNCWEFVLYSAYKGGFTTKGRLQAIYTSAAAKIGLGIPREIERLVCGSRYSFDLTKPRSREPIRGDIVIFKEFAGHVAISLGTKTASGNHEVMNLLGNRVYRTTIETLARAMNLTRIDFCTPKW